MEFSAILGHYRSMIAIAEALGETGNNIKETLIMQKFAMACIYKDKLSDFPSLRQRLYLEAINLQENIQNQNCKDELKSWIEHCESLGHSSNFTVQTQTWN